MGTQKNRLNEMFSDHTKRVFRLMGKLIITILRSLFGLSRSSGDSGVLLEPPSPQPTPTVLKHPMKMKLFHFF